LYTALAISPILATPKNVIQRKINTKNKKIFWSLAWAFFFSPIIMIAGYTEKIERIPNPHWNIYLLVVFEKCCIIP
jgi:hypothetical protein